MTIVDIREGNRLFKDNFAGNRDVFEKLAREGQQPTVLWIGCSDSRVVPEQITGAQAGDLFVVRNIANVVPPSKGYSSSGTVSDTVGAVIEYAVLHLKVSHIIVCGHTECGGIKALEGTPDRTKEPHISRWLELARPARKQVERDGIKAEERYLATITTNVLLQCKHVRTYPCVREAERKGGLQVYGWLYDLHTGSLLSHNEKTGRWDKITGES